MLPRCIHGEGFSERVVRQTSGERFKIRFAVADH